MSKRGSHNAIHFAGKNWGLSKAKISSTDIQQIKKTKRKERKEKKKRRIENQFGRIAEKFNLDISKPKNLALFERTEKLFCSISSSKTRTAAVQNVKSFKLYCKKYDEDFQIENYFDKKYYLVNFKKDFPDVYYFNVLKQGLMEDRK